MVDIALLVTITSVIFSALGVSVVLKDYIASVLAGVIMRHVKQIKPNRRIKILTIPTIKGDVVKIGLVRTSLIEVGDGERLPSVQTGRILNIPNFMVLNNPVLVYGETIIDEVIAYLSWPHPDLDKVIGDMREAIQSQDLRVIEVGLYQRKDKLVVHGIFESKTHEVTDVRSNILKEFLQKQQTVE